MYQVQKEFFPSIVDIGTEHDQDADSIPLLPTWLSSSFTPDEPLIAKPLLPAEFDDLMQTILTFGTNKYIMDWDNIKLYWSSFMANEQMNLGLLNTSTTNRAESTFNFDHVASNYNSSASDSHVVHISNALLFPIQYVTRLASSSSASAGHESSGVHEEKEERRDII